MSTSTAISHMTAASILVSGFALVAHVKDAHDPQRAVEAIEREITAGTVGNHQFAKRPSHSTSDAWMARQNAHGIRYLRDRVLDGFWRGIKQEVDNALQITQCVG